MKKYQIFLVDSEPGFCLLGSLKLNYSDPNLNNTGTYSKFK